nr:chitinase [Butyrivibrio sp.]
MKKKVLPVIFIIAIIILIGIIYVGQQFVQKFSYSNDIADFSSYFGVTSSEDIPIVLGTEKLEVFARNTDGVYYMDFNNVQTYLNDRFYCGTEDGILVYTTPTEIISSVIGTNSYTVNGADEQSLEYTISYYDGDILYVALPYVQKYTDFTFEGFDSPSYVYIVNAWNEQTQATVNKDTKLRIKGGVKSEILESVEAEETVIVLEEMETWTKVETARGLIGYIENKRLDNIQTVTPTHEAVYVEPEYTSLTRDYKINMGFNAIGGEGGNDSMESLVAATKSLNVISPTWYALSDNLGNIRSYASSDYVTKAHALGLEVWALVDNFTGPEGVSTQEILSHASSRQTLITNLIDQAGTYGFDGINIDFESIDSSYAQSYIEFIREISIACRANGLVLSIDNYVPMNFNDFYDLEEQGTVADYVVIMGYDEHYAGSEEAG